MLLIYQFDANCVIYIKIGILYIFVDQITHLKMHELNKQVQTGSNDMYINQ